MKLSNAVSVEYNSDSKTVVVSFPDGAQSSWPVRLLEMVERTEDGYSSINPSEDELAAVELFGGDSILWDELGQIFKIRRSPKSYLRAKSLDGVDYSYCPCLDEG